ncbi:MAG: carboxypeptidase regulatory-like domain-containing protein [Bryobacteraceae bacterium]|nr:carboxypeptidase regulatory-like domain-containing protein [Bryobacteraceae bacterium]
MLTIRILTMAALVGPASVIAQDPVGAVEGSVLDSSGGRILTAQVKVTHLDTGQAKSVAAAEGYYRIPMLPVGRYALSIEAPGFTTFARKPVTLEVSQVLRLDVRMELAGVRESVSVTGEAETVDTAGNAIGKTVTTREILDLPLNGRNFTQLGLLQAGVAALTGGVSTAGGSLRSGQAYAVNGQRPESNNFLLDGARNVNRMDGGFALRPPVDSIAEFRILTHTAPPEYGGTAGSNTSVVTKSGGNDTHGTLYEFFRNDVFDARNFFSAGVEPLKQNQFGGTLGGPIQRNRLFYFGYAEGFRNRQGITRSGNVPSPAQRSGDYSGRVPPLLNLAGGGVPFPNNQIPASQFHAVGLRAAALYPLGNTTPSVYTGTVVTENESDQAGGRLDYLVSDRDQMHLRHSFSGGYNVNPISIRGSDLPGFPVRDELRTNSTAVNETHVFTPNLVNSFRAAFFRHVFRFDQRLNQVTPRDFGFNYDSASAQGQSAPFFNVNGYSPVGGAITGPRTSAQTSVEIYDAVNWVRGRHSWKLGGEARRVHLNLFQAIAPNAFFVFAPSFPTNDAFANLLLGRPVVFYQGLGDLSRGLRSWESAIFVQDEWRVNRKLTLNYGLRWEVNTPLEEVRDRLNAFVPGVKSTVNPEAPVGLLFPGDAGVARAVAPVFYKGLMPRLGAAWNPDGRGLTSIRASYGIFFDPLANGSGVASQVPVSSLPWTQLVQFSGPGVNFADPYAGQGRPAGGSFPRPLTLVVMDRNARPPYAQNWNLSVQRSLQANYVVDVRYIGSKGTRLPRNIEANPAVFGPGATSANADRRRLYANCPAAGACDFTHVAMLSYITNSTYHAGQISLSRRYASGAGFNLSYWFSKTLDYLSAMNLGGAAARPLAGENDIAQNPFDLRAERGPSLFDARHRFVLSGSWEIGVARNSRGRTRALLHGWQVHAIATVHSGTPFTVFDTTNVSLQASHPPISGYSASRPDVLSDPNQGQGSVEQWISRTAFRRLDPATETGRFGNAGRNIARAPGLANVDLSLVRPIPLSERVKLQFRAECFNVANRANFAVPVSDLNSANFGRILEAAPSRLLQLALKVTF